MESKTPIPRMTSASQSASEMLGSPRPTRMLASLEGVSSQHKKTQKLSHRSRKTVWVPLFVVVAAVGVGWLAWTTNEARIANAERGNPVQLEDAVVFEEVRGAQRASVVQLAMDDGKQTTATAVSKAKQTASNASPGNAAPAAAPVKVAANSSITSLTEAAPPTRRRTSATDPIPEPVQFVSIDLEKNPGPKVEFIDPEEAVAAGKQAARAKPARPPSGRPPVAVASTGSKARPVADALPRVTPTPAAAPARAAQQEDDAEAMMLAGLLGTLEEKPQKPTAAPVKEQPQRMAQVPPRQTAATKSHVPRTVRLERCNRMFVGKERANCRQAVCGGLWGEVPECPADRRFF